jgi:hypothetical protein
MVGSDELQGMPWPWPSSSHTQDKEEARIHPEQTLHSRTATGCTLRKIVRRLLANLDRNRSVALMLCDLLPSNRSRVRGKLGFRMHTEDILRPDTGNIVVGVAFFRLTATGVRSALCLRNLKGMHGLRRILVTGLMTQAPER